MSDKTSLSKEYSAYFLLDEGKLRKLIDVLTGYSRKKEYECEVEYTVEKVGDSEYNTTSLDTVLKDDNMGFLLCVFAINLIYPISQRRLGDLNLVEFGLVIGIGITLVMLIYDRLAYRLKPMERLSNLTNINSVFYWGDQRDAYDSQRSFKQNIKWIVIIGFLVSAAAGVLVAVILNRK